MLRKIYHAIYWRLKEGRIHRQRRRGLVGKEDRKTGLTEEGDFWEKALANGGSDWDVAQFTERTDPNLELQTDLQALLRAPAGSRVEILDVGSGPLTRVGRKWVGREVHIVATDPLAERYVGMLQRHGVRAPVPVVFAEGEKLLDQFPENHFDLAYASNALDHCANPLAVIGQMLAVIKPDHYAYLWHFANEGKHQFYYGLHQWNFDVARGDFIISDGQVTHSLARHFAAAAELACEETRAFGHRVVIAKLRKRAA